MNKEEKAKPKEDKTDEPEDAEKAKQEQKKVVEDTIKEKKAFEHKELEQKAAEKFANTIAGAADSADAASEDVVVQNPENKLASTIG